MTLFESIRGEDRAPGGGVRSVIRWLRRRVPTGLYARALLIIILPMLILFLFAQKHIIKGMTEGAIKS